MFFKFINLKFSIMNKKFLSAILFGGLDGFVNGNICVL